MPTDSTEVAALRGTHAERDNKQRYEEAFCHCALAVVVAGGVDPAANRLLRFHTAGINAAGYRFGCALSLKKKRAE